MAKNGKNRPNLLPNQVLYQAELRSDEQEGHDDTSWRGCKRNSNGIRSGAIMSDTIIEDSPKRRVRFERGKPPRRRGSKIEDASWPK
jgi:hypothetical protein